MGTLEKRSDTNNDWAHACTKKEMGDEDLDCHRASLCLQCKWMTATPQ